MKGTCYEGDAQRSTLTQWFSTGENRLPTTNEDMSESEMKAELEKQFDALEYLIRINIIYNYSMIIIILYLLTIVMNVGVVLFVTSPRFEKVCKDVMKLKKNSKN